MCQGCSETIPKVSQNTARCAQILNCIFPGVGTMVASCYDVKGFNFQQFWIGILQAFTCFLIIGWIWSIWWGYQIVDRANDDDFVPLEEKEKFDKDHSHNA